MNLGRREWGGLRFCVCSVPVLTLLGVNHIFAAKQLGSKSLSLAQKHCCAETDSWPELSAWAGITSHAHDSP